MVSIIEKKANGGDYIYKFVGLSTDEKPKTSNGSVFTEMDTKKVFQYNKESEGWIGEATKYLTSIAVTTQPTKTTYTEGESFDATGMVVTATYTDSSTSAVTGFTVECADPLTAETSSVLVKYVENGISRTTKQAITVAPVTLASIEVTTSPKTEYKAGDALDLTGVAVTATYTDESTKEVTENCTFAPVEGTLLTVEDTAITVTYTEGDTTKTDTITITVTEDQEEQA